MSNEYEIEINLWEYRALYSFLWLMIIGGWFIQALKLDISSLLHYHQMFLYKEQNILKC